MDGIIEAWNKMPKREQLSMRLHALKSTNIGSFCDTPRAREAMGEHAKTLLFVHSELEKIKCLPIS